MDYSLKFGSYEFPRTFYPASVPQNSRVPITEIPRRDGGVLGDQRVAHKVITVQGMLRGDTAQDLRDAMDDLLSALNDGRQQLTVWDDRYIHAVKQAVSTDYDPTSFKRYCNVSIQFLCDDPFWEAVTESSDTWASPTGSHDIEIGGNAPAVPTFEFTVGDGGELDIQLTCGDYGFTLTGTVQAGQVIVVDNLEMSVEIDALDYMSMFDFDFIRLTGGATNRLEYSSDGAATISQIVTKWRNRWY